MSLRTRLLLAALLPVTLVALLLTLAFLSHVLDQLERGQHTRGSVISRQLATAAEYGIFSGQRDHLSLLVDGALRSDPDIRGVAVVDVNGTVIARSGQLHPQEWPNLDHPDGIPLSHKERLFVEPVTRNTLPVDDIYGGIESPPTALQPLPLAVIGHVVIEFSPRAITDQRDRLITAGLLIALLGVALGGWLARRISRSVTGPLLEAMDVVESIGEGHLAARMRVSHNDTLSSLAQGINAMAERISLTQDELRQRITEATRDLQHQKEAAERATAAKSHFLASASHDLRQPLHALGLFVSGLSHTKVAHDEPVLIGRIQSAVATLQDLFDAILDISRLDGGHVIPRINAFPLAPILDKLGKELFLLAEQKGLQLRIRPTVLWAHSDRQLVERILLNLIANALRYTDRGGVLVTCRRRAETVRIEVWDTGSGIPDEAQKEIFDEYVQLGNSERDRDKGLGLGLAICRRLADLLGACIGLRSRTGRGSMFWLELSRVDADQNQHLPYVTPRTTPALREDTNPATLNGLFLVIEDDELVRNGMAQLLERWGGRVLLAGDRKEALARCQESQTLPEALICDIRLPDQVNGIDLAQELIAEHGNMNVLLISADVSEDTQTAARRAGFAILKKPVPAGRLRAALQHLQNSRPL